MKKNIVIIGAGPRGLAVALRALNYKEQYSIYLIDNNPLNTWKFPNMLRNMQMRSPITFDLTTFQNDLYYKYSLAKFLNIKLEMPRHQKQIEQNNIFCQRNKFVKYLEYILAKVNTLGVNFIGQKVVDINEKSLELEKVKLDYNYLIICSGAANQIINYPNYLNPDKINLVKDIWNKSWLNQEVNIVGSGQQAAELVYYLLTQGALVNWIKQYEPKVNQYPVPGFTQWGIASALGNYYAKTLSYTANRNKYLAKVKAWTPSITPDIKAKLDKYKFKSINPNSTKEINVEAPFILAGGVTQEVDLVPFKFEISKDLNSPNLPEFGKCFSSSSHPNIYFSGLLALRHDGPRQGSVISAGPTAKVIIDNIINN